MEFSGIVCPPINQSLFCATTAVCIYHGWSISAIVRTKSSSNPSMSAYVVLPFGELQPPAI